MFWFHAIIFYEVPKKMRENAKWNSVSYVKKFQFEFRWCCTHHTNSLFPSMNTVNTCCYRNGNLIPLILTILSLYRLCNIFYTTLKKLFLSGLFEGHRSKIFQFVIMSLLALNSLLKSRTFVMFSISVVHLRNLTVLKLSK